LVGQPTDVHKSEDRKGEKTQVEPEMEEDERIIASMRFIEDDDFIKTPKFKDFLAENENERI